MIAVAISFISLLVSFSSFYYANLVIRHNLSATADYSLSDRNVGKTVKDFSSKFQVRVILRNNGNRSEAILRLAIYSVSSSPGPSAFILKPGDLQVFDLEEDMNLFKANLAAAAEMAERCGKDSGDWTEFGIISRVIMADGSISERLSPLGSVRAGASDTDRSAYLDVRTNLNMGKNIRLLLQTIWF